MNLNVVTPSVGLTITMTKTTQNKKKYYYISPKIDRFFKGKKKKKIFFQNKVMNSK